MIVNVTQEHLNKGKRKDIHACPAALAVQEAFSDPHATVGSFTFANEIIYITPEIAMRFIVDFDKSKSTEGFTPFEFTLEEENGLRLTPKHQE